MNYVIQVPLWHRDDIHTSFANLQPNNFGKKSEHKFKISCENYKRIAFEYNVLEFIVEKFRPIKTSGWRYWGAYFFVIFTQNRAG